jgi:hypothetical protein
MSQGQDKNKNPEDRISLDVPRSGYLQESWKQDFSGSMKQIYQDFNHVLIPRLSWDILFQCCP